MELTVEQNSAIAQAKDFLSSDGKLLTIGGAAGTGKSTILKEIISDIPDLAVAAYCGKAASVLRKKGVEATTIHRRIYKWVEAYQQFERIKDVGYRGFVIDEGSMIGGDIFGDLQAYGLPILVIGDNYQLEPVSGKDLNLMKNPDIMLTEIHRQARDNPIIDLATRVRKGEPWGFQDSDERCIVDRQSAMWSSIEWADIVICGYNRTRIEINKRKRFNLKYSRPLEEGDRIICLQNDKVLGVFNGLMFQVQKIREVQAQYTRADVLSDDGVTRENLPIWMGAFDKVKLPDWKVLRRFSGKALVADYGYGITAHKSQGSEWDKVVVLSQKAEKLWNQVRWDYTAFTRASQFLRAFI